MTRLLPFGTLLLLILCAVVQAQVSGDVLGSHDLSPTGTSPIKGKLASGCQYCHAPHSSLHVGRAPLWSQTLSRQSYTLYTSSTLANPTQQPVLGDDSSLCLSCHDGTVAPGQTVPYGRLRMTGSMLAQDKFGRNLSGSHPFSFQNLKTDTPNLVNGLIANHTTADKTLAVKLINNNVECTSCHNPHVEGIDIVAKQFLVRDGSMGALCLACHEPGPRTLNNVKNPLSPWATSIHATANHKLAQGSGLGSYATVATNACASCHMEHNASAGAELLREPASPVPNMDATTQNCMTCHNGGTNISPAIPNVYAEFAKTGHPFPSGNNIHTTNEAIVLDNNRHATCVDCHNAHAAQQVTSFTTPPSIRVSEASTNGVASDGTTKMTPALNQYENCLRCHGPSAGKQTLSTFGYFPVRAAANAGDPLNVIYEFTSASTSRHPVMVDAGTGLAQPSLLTAMLQLDGKAQGRTMGSRIFCTDCHNSDDNREFGGTGPNGPHGSTYSHILERRYEFSQVAVSGGPGSAVTNLFPNPVLDPSASGPYNMCAKCHDLNNIVSDATFKPNNAGKGGHATHINIGFSCSVCHTSHGMGATVSGISGERMVNFDLKVVAPNNGTLSYTRANNNCTLTCHGYAHNSNGTVTQAIQTTVKRKR